MNNRLKIEFDSAAIPESQRLRHWQDLVGDHLADVDMRQPKHVSRAESYCGLMSLDAYPDVTFARVTSANQLLMRTPERIRRASHETALVNILISGECQVEQEGRRALMKPGDLCLYESVRPYDIRVPGPIEVLVVMADRQKVEAAFGNLRLFTGLVSDGTKPSSVIAGQYWRSLAAQAAGLNDFEIAPLVAAGFDFLRVALASVPSSGCAPSGAYAVQRAKTFIKENFHRSDIAPAEIARAAGLSLRRLQELFQAEGITILGHLHRLRMEAAHRVLADPSFAKWSISSIMERVGFIDQSQFARAFRKAYGQSPRAMRNAKKNEPDAAGS
ncbi:MAG: helix-turn-helix domain-containing protein [Methylovirgula sp.]